MNVIIVGLLIYLPLFLVPKAFGFGNMFKFTEEENQRAKDNPRLVMLCWVIIFSCWGIAIFGVME